MLRATVLRSAAAIFALPGLACSIGTGAGSGAGAAHSSAAADRGAIPVSSAPAATALASGFDPAHVAEVLGPAVGEIIVTTRTGQAEGSGFVIQVQGNVSYMLTNNHVVNGARSVQVLMPDGRHYMAEITGTDSYEDLAVIKIPDKLPLAQFGDSTKVRVGQAVVAIGSPLGQEASVTSGIISALHRTVTAGDGGSGATETLPDALQTDAPINPGNSGGPLADGNGSVIGINTAANSTASGIGFAIPSLIARRIAESLIAGRKPGHPYLGVCFTPLDQALAAGRTVDGYGVVVTGVVSGGPASKAGLKGGDVIQKVDGVDLNNGQSLGGVLQLHNPGDSVSVSVRRSGANQDLNATLADRPTATAAPGC